MPHLRHEKGDDKADGNGKKGGNGRPLFAARFFVNGVDGSRAGVVQEGEEHEVNGR